MWTDTHLAFIAACLLATVVAIPLHAAELEDKEVGAALLDDLQSALRGKQADAIGNHVERIADAYTTIEDEAVRSRLMKGVGKATRFDDDGVRRAALRAFEQMRDPAAWRYLAPFLDQSDRREKPAFFDEALRATERLAPDAAVPVLLRLVQKSRHLGVASGTMEALAAFKQSKHREKILEAIIDTTRKERPGVKGRENPNDWGPRYTGQEARTRWEALSRPMVETANELTGQRIGSATDWFAIWADNKRDPAGLFERDDG